MLFFLDDLWMMRNKTSECMRINRALGFIWSHESYHSANFEVNTNYTLCLRAEAGAEIIELKFLAFNIGDLDITLDGCVYTNAAASDKTRSVG